MEGFGNYDPDAEDNRKGVLAHVEKSVAVITNLGEYVPDAWKNRLGLYEHPLGRGASYRYTGSEGREERTTRSGFNYQPRLARDDRSSDQAWPVGRSCGIGRGDGIAVDLANRSDNRGADFREAVDEPSWRSNGNSSHRDYVDRDYGGRDYAGRGGYSSKTVKGSPSPTGEFSFRQFSDQMDEYSPVVVGDYEKQLVRRIVQPRGGRAVPPLGELDGFRREASAVDLNSILEAIKEYVLNEAQSWQWKLRALALLQTLLVKDRLDPHLAGRVRTLIQNDEVLLRALSTIQQKQCAPLAEEILGSLDISRSRTAPLETRHRAGNRAGGRATHTIDLLSAADDCDPPACETNIDLIGIDSHTPSRQTMPKGIPPSHTDPCSKVDLLDDLLL